MSTTETGLNKQSELVTSTQSRNHNASNGSEATADKMEEAMKKSNFTCLNQWSTNALSLNTT